MPVLEMHLATAFAAVENLDWDAVETLRSTFVADDHASAAELYFRLPTWQHKALLVQLVQDKITDAIAPVMVDFLSAPPADDDTIWLSKVVAILHLERSFERFMALYDAGAEAVEAESRAILAKR